METIRQFSNPRRRLQTDVSVPGWLEIHAVAVANAEITLRSFAELATKSPQSDRDEAHWPPRDLSAASDWIMPGWGTTIGRGIIGNCPHCGQAPIFNGYLKVHEVCAACAAPLGQMPADDTPPYIAMVVVAHFVGLFIVLMFKFHWHPGPIAIGVLLVLLVLLCMGVLRMAKGAVIGILLKLDNNREKPNE